jgi:hypothetical protein
LVEERVEILRSEIAKLRTQLQMRTEENDFGSISEKAGEEPTAPIKQNKYLRLENEQLRELTKTLQQEAAALREQLKERDAEETFEEELQRRRQTLLEERAALEKQLADMREDRKELDAAAQAAEMQVAKEQATIAREWAELNQKREEFRMEMEKEKRDSIRDSLERVRKIKEESQMKRQANPAVLVAQRIGELQKEK